MGYVKPGIDISKYDFDKPIGQKPIKLDEGYFKMVDEQVRAFDEVHQYDWVPLESPAELALDLYCASDEPKSSPIGFTIACPECDKEGFIYSGDYICVQCRYQ